MTQAYLTAGSSRFPPNSVRVTPRCDPPIPPRQWPPSGESEKQSFTSDEERKRYEIDEKQKARLRRWAARSDFRRRALRPGAVVFAAVAAVDAAGLGLQAADVPDDWWGEEGENTSLDYIVALVAALGILAAAVLAESYRRLLVDRVVDRRLEELARSIAREVRNLSGVSTDIISVHIWELIDPRVYLIPRWLPRRPHARHLARRAAFVPERREHESIAFMEGFGVVGRCWQRKREVVEDLSVILENAPDATSYYARFGYEQRYRLNYANLWNTRHFWAIWAYPIFVGPPAGKDFGGCVSVDFQCPDHADKLRSVADNRSQELDSLLADCAALLRGDAVAA